MQGMQKPVLAVSALIFLFSCGTDQEYSTLQESSYGIYQDDNGNNKLRQDPRIAAWKYQVYQRDLKTGRNT